MPAPSLVRYSPHMRHVDLRHTCEDDDDIDGSEGCVPCLTATEAKSECRCGACCRSLILEACVQDAEVEPRIKELCGELREMGDEVIGYLLNAPDGPCTFLDRQANLCTIYE